MAMASGRSDTVGEWVSCLAFESSSIVVPVHSVMGNSGNAS